MQKTEARISFKNCCTYCLPICFIQESTAVSAVCVSTHLVHLYRVWRLHPKTAYQVSFQKLYLRVRRLRPKRAYQVSFRKLYLKSLAATPKNSLSGQFPKVIFTEVGSYTVTPKNSLWGQFPKVKFFHGNICVTSV